MQVVCCRILKPVIYELTTVIYRMQWNTCVWEHSVEKENPADETPKPEKNRSRETRTNFWYKQTSRRPAPNPIAYIDTGIGVPRDQSVHNTACVWIIGGRSVEFQSCPNYEKHCAVTHLYLEKALVSKSCQSTPY